ncbi:DUF4382 domain-containing protein [Marinobacter caseinilyticus]|uniref:DUF4382 domain-containing protein n=1 Tax=Marinobacter caseinilyticus TaxID=2692195 RepID=UPI0014097EFD|nr:DUF4382 domain-containing protein [Marinobacter caseinilyticus]
MKTSMTYLSVIALTGALTACGGGGSDVGSTGSVSVGVTDAPAMEFTNVTVSFIGISLKPVDGDWVKFTFDEPKAWNLLDLQGGLSEPLITDEEVPAGQYSELRLLVNTADSFVVLKDQPDVEASLAVPSGESSGLKLKGDFFVAADTSTGFTVDFDVRKSIVNPTGESLADYLLKPSLRLVNNLQVGAIEGEVDYVTIQQTRSSDDALANCSADYAGAVYIYRGADVTPTDINVTTEGGPLLAIPVADLDNDGLYNYTAAFLPADDYTLSYSCQLDDNELDDALEFEGTQNVTVIASTTTEANAIPLVP